MLGFLAGYMTVSAIKSNPQAARRIAVSLVKTALAAQHETRRAIARFTEDVVDIVAEARASFEAEQRAAQPRDATQSQSEPSAVV